jgi:hypothetical protein
VFLFDSGSPCSAILVYADDRDGHFLKPRFGFASRRFSVTPPCHIEDFTPIHGGHKERPFRLDGLLQKSLNFRGCALAIFEQAD